MQGRQKQVIEMYQRVQDFLGANPPPASAGYTIQKRRLDEIVATDHSTDQLLGRRMSQSASHREEALRKQLRRRASRVCAIGVHRLTTSLAPLDLARGRS